jgi:hypothetical protein
MGKRKSPLNLEQSRPEQQQKASAQSDRTQNLRGLTILLAAQERSSCRGFKKYEAVYAQQGGGGVSPVAAMAVERVVVFGSFGFSSAICSSVLSWCL